MIKRPPVPGVPAVCFAAVGQQGHAAIFCAAAQAASPFAACSTPVS
jgi:hypothetical protein